MTEPISSSTSAILGPTNTGKTHRALERMLEHDSGMIGLPLRLLAREVYDKLTASLGERQVALVTGEEKRVPRAPRYWVCTVEAMPLDLEVDFVAVDEIQLAAHRERGHVFTDRLLHARGRIETWFLGSDTVRKIIEVVVPTADIRSHPRLSRLTYAGAHTIGSLPPKSAVVAFSMKRVYELAERLRRKRGGAAVVLGALSPRARNAQVALYQAGEVNYMVATDAIGMGLNLDIDHVAFADARKFDGREARDLEIAEMAQIAGRAGRFLRDGTFGVLSPLSPLSDRAIGALEGHRFAPVDRLEWRSRDLDMRSTDALVTSLRVAPSMRVFRRTDDGEDLRALIALSAKDTVRRLAHGEEAVSLLWEVCRVPDYRQILFEDHIATLESIYVALRSPRGHLDADVVRDKLRGIDAESGDLDTLLDKLAAIRTWNYVATQGRWVEDAPAIADEARRIEDRLSDALHQALVARFVDSKATTAHPAAAPRPMKPGEKPRELQAPSPSSPFAKLASLKVSRTAPVEITPASFVESLVEADDEAFSLDLRGRLLFGEEVIARLARGKSVLEPDVKITSEASPGEKLRMARRLVAWLRDLGGELASAFTPPSARALSPAGRGVLYLLQQRAGTLAVHEARTEVASLTDDDRRLFLGVGMVIGEAVLYSPRLQKPFEIERRGVFANALLDRQIPWPDGKQVSVAVDASIPTVAYSMVGYPAVGPRAIRADILERVVGRWRAAPEGERESLGVAGWLGCRSNDAQEVMSRLV